MIALDFYDGATEGFSLLDIDLGAIYFKIIAWDKNQDQRLFVAIPIGKETFNYIFELLRKINDEPTEKTWIPKWEFSNEYDRRELDSVIEASKNGLKANSILILGSQINSKPINIFPVNSHTGKRIENAIREVEDIDDWLPLLGIDKA